MDIKDTRTMAGGIVGLIVLAFALDAEAVSMRVASFRWRNDDGGETNATWRADPDFPAMFPTNGNIRLRVCIEHFTNSVLSQSIVMQYTDNPQDGGDPNRSYIGESWISITNSVGATTQAFAMASSPWLVDGAPTTDQLPGLVAGSTFQAGSIFEDPSAPVASVALPVGRYSNYEFCFRPTAHAITNRVYYFRTLSPCLGAPKLKLECDPLGDVNHDGVVNETDLNEVISHFGQRYR